jgi:hypothetical protein
MPDTTRSHLDPAEPMPMRPLRPPDEVKNLAWKATFAGWATALIAGVILVAILAATLVTVVTIRATQKTNTNTVDLIRDCTEPKGKCFQRGQDQTAGAIADINQVTVYAAACASKVPGQTAEQIQRCVVRLLADDARKSKKGNR